MYRPRLRDGSGHGWERDSIPDDRKSTTPIDVRANESPAFLKPDANLRVSTLTSSVFELPASFFSADSLAKAAPYRQVKDGPKLTPLDVLKSQKEKKRKTEREAEMKNVEPTAARASQVSSMPALHKESPIGIKAPHQQFVPSSNGSRQVARAQGGTDRSAPAVATPSVTPVRPSSSIISVKPADASLLPSVTKPSISHKPADASPRPPVVVKTWGVVSKPKPIVKSRFPADTEKFRELIKLRIVTKDGETKSVPSSSASCVSPCPRPSTPKEEEVQSSSQLKNGGEKEEESKEAKEEKKSSLESLVSRIRVDADSAASSQSPSPTPSACSSQQSSADSEMDGEARKNRRKSGEPVKITSEEESPPLLHAQQPPRRGGRKKKGGRKPPPPKRRKVVDEAEEAEEEREDDEREDGGEWVEINVVKEPPYWPEDRYAYYEGDDPRLPPRIIVEGQEPGVVLDWDEEEIIILRDGEEPEQRPPRLQRAPAPPEEEQWAAYREIKEEPAPLEEAPIVEETGPMDGSVAEEDDDVMNVSAAISLDAATPSDDDLLVSPDHHHDDAARKDESSTQSSTASHTPTTTPSPALVSPACGLPEAPADIPGIPEITGSVAPKKKYKKRGSTESTSSMDGAAAGRTKRVVKTRARYSPTPEEAVPSSSSRFYPQMGGMETNGLIGHQIAPNTA